MVTSFALQSCRPLPPVQENPTRGIAVASQVPTAGGSPSAGLVSAEMLARMAFEESYLASAFLTNAPVLGAFEPIDHGANLLSPVFWSPAAASTSTQTLKPVGGGLSHDDIGKFFIPQTGWKAPSGTVLNVRAGSQLADASPAASTLDLPPGQRSSILLERLLASKAQIEAGQTDFNALDETINFKQANEALDGLVDQIQGTPGNASDYAAQATRGLLGFGKSIITGVGELAYEGIKAVPKLGRLAFTSDGQAISALTGQILAENIRLGNITTGTVGQGALDIGAALAKPVVEPWEKGNYTEAVTRGAAEILTLPFAWSKIGKVADMAIAKTALEVADAVKARAALEAAEIANAPAAIKATAGVEVADAAVASRAADLLLDRAQQYAELINANKPWSWKNDFPGGESLTAGEKVAIKKRAVAEALIQDVPFKGETRFPDFGAAGLVIKTDFLLERLWLQGDAAQFKWLDSQIQGGRPAGTTWHHSEIPGRMELIPFGPHNIINHQGGRSPGLWAEGNR